jgi:hypothetical protein
MFTTAGMILDAVALIWDWRSRTEAEEDGMDALERAAAAAIA